MRGATIGGDARSTIDMSTSGRGSWQRTMHPGKRTAVAVPPLGKHWNCVVPTSLPRIDEIHENDELSFDKRPPDEPMALLRDASKPAPFTPRPRQTDALCHGAKQVHKKVSFDLEAIGHVAREMGQTDSVAVKIKKMGSIQWKRFKVDSVHQEQWLRDIDNKGNQGGQRQPPLRQIPSREIWEEAMIQAAEARAKTTSRSLGECMGNMLKADLLRFSPGARSFHAARTRLRARVCLSAHETPDSTNSLAFLVGIEIDGAGQVCLSLREGCRKPHLARKARSLDHSFAEDVPLCGLELLRIGEHSFVMIPLMLGKLSKADICSTIEDLTTLVLEDEAQTNQFLSMLDSQREQWTDDDSHDHFLRRCRGDCANIKTNDGILLHAKPGYVSRKLARQRAKLQS